MTHWKKATLAAALGGVMLGTVSSTTPVKAADPDPVAAIALSFVFSGAGEWYNSGFEGGFPIVECILGYICPCVRVASWLDAAAGRTDDKTRFNFWSSPNK